MVFTGIPTVYNPLKAGSIDGTDTEPHDHAVFRAMNATYKPNKFVCGDPEATVFVARLNRVKTNEESLQKAFDKFGKIKHIRVVRNIVTGFSQGYAFIEFEDVKSAICASRDGNNMVVDDFELLVDMECERTLKGWIPRRLGGGFGGKKESGQLRFGCKDRPFRKPFIIGEEKTFERKLSRSDEYCRDYKIPGRSGNQDDEDHSRREHISRNEFRKRRRSRSRSRSRSPNRSKRRPRDTSRETHRHRYRD